MEIDKLEGLHTPLEKMDCLKKMLVSDMVLLIWLNSTFSESGESEISEKVIITCNIFNGEPVLPNSPTRDLFKLTLDATLERALWQ